MRAENDDSSQTENTIAWPSNISDMVKQSYQSNKYLGKLMI